MDLIFVSKRFHVEYELLERNLRRVLEKTKQHYRGKILLIYGDLCLGPNGETKQLAEEHKIVKVDALGGKGKFLEADPSHDSFSRTRHCRILQAHEGKDAEEKHE